MGNHPTPECAEDFNSRRRSLPDRCNINRRTKKQEGVGGRGGGGGGTVWRPSTSTAADVPEGTQRDLMANYVSIRRPATSESADADADAAGIDGRRGPLAATCCCVAEFLFGFAFSSIRFGRFFPKKKNEILDCHRLPVTGFLPSFF